MAQSFKMKVLTLITKLSDRDTYTAAAHQLESIVATLDGSTLPTFLSCILSTDSADKALVRKQCLRLLSLLSLLHSNSLSSFLPKIITYLTRRLRDLDSSIRSECVSAVSSLSSNVTRPPFSSAFLKPLSEAVFTEQDLNAQVGSALCLAAAIDSAPDPDPGRLGKALVTRLERLVKNDAYKAKSAGLVVLGSVIGVGGVRGYAGMSGLVKCLTGFLSHQDWAARKAAAEALCRLAIAERDAVAEFKSDCLKVFENRRFDKVKATREVMSQMIEAWKQVPDVSDEPSPPPRSQASSKDEVADGRNPPSGSRKPYSPSTEPAQTRTRGVLSAVCTPANGFSSRKRGSVKSTDKKKGPTMTQQQVDRKKPLDWKEEVAVSGSSFTGVGDDTSMKRVIDDAPQSRLTKPATRRALFGRNSDDKAAKSSGFKSGSRVAPQDDNANTTAVTNSVENHNSNPKDSEDLSLIRSQLLQIERQQSSLLDLLQRFIGSSQNGMSSLETRVHGLELALDEISYDLAVSNGRMGNSHATPCCRIPGADYLSSKLWRKGEDHHNPTWRSRMAGRGERRGSSHETFNLDNCRLHLQRRGGLIVNPLAEIHDLRATSEMGRQ